MVVYIVIRYKMLKDIQVLKNAVDTLKIWKILALNSLQ